MSFSLFETRELERGLDLCSLRNNVISSNIANAHSPDYQANAVSFQAQMGQASESDAKHSNRFFQAREPKVQDAGKPVDIIAEMVNLSKNQILYHAYSDQLTRHFSNLEWIINNAGR